MFEAFLAQKKRRFIISIAGLLLCLLSGFAVFSLLISALSASGAGAMAVPGAFVCLLIYEFARYFFYRSFYVQQLARFAAWKQAEIEGKL